MKRAYLKYIAALLLFGTNGIVANFVSLESYETVFWRTLIGSVILIAAFFLKGGKLTFYKKKKSFAFLFVSGVAMGASWIFLYEAYSKIGVGLSSLLYYCGPVIVMALSPLLFKERLTAVKVFSFVCVVAGIFAVSSVANQSKSDVFAIACGLLSAVMYSFMVIFNKKAKEISGLENSMLQLFISFLTAFVFAAFKNSMHFGILKSDVLPLIILGAVNTGLGCFLYFSSIGQLPAQSVAVCGYLEPLSAVVFSAAVLGEKMSFSQIFGAFLIIGGAAVGECVEIKRKEDKKN